MYRSDKVKDYTVSESGRMARYHYVERGARTFAVMKGSVQVISNGRKFVLTEDDIFNAEAWCPYSMTFLSDDTVVRGISLFGPEPQKDLPDPAAWAYVDKSSVLEVSAKGQGIYEFSVAGIEFLLKVGRWQLDGLKEIWEFRIEKGYRLAFNDRTDKEGLFMVKTGRFRVEIGDDEFVADEGEGDLIRIPANTAYSLTALSDDCVIHDFNVTCHLFRLLEMIEAARDYFPEKLSDEEYIDYLLEANKVHMFESFGKVE